MNNIQTTTAPFSAKPKTSKWGKLLGNKQDTIEEVAEEETKVDKSNLLMVEVRDTGKLDPIQDSAPLTVRDVNVAIGAHLPNSSPLSPTEQHLIASLYDIKLEIKEEIENLNSKMNKIDEQITGILKLFTPQSSPYSSHTPSLSSRGHSSASSNSGLTSGPSSCNSSVTSGNLQSATSPTGSVPSSPQKTQHNNHSYSTNVSSSSKSSSVSSAQNTSSQGPAAAPNSSTTMTAAAAASATTRQMIEKASSHDSSQGGDSSSRTSTPTSRPSTSSSRKSSARKRRSKKVAPQEMHHTGSEDGVDEDEHIPVKDRDLDIF